MDVEATAARLPSRACAGCTLEKPAEAFRSAKARKCRECLRRNKRAYNKRWYKTEKGRAYRRAEARRKAKRPRRKYYKHREHATARGIPFLLTFDQWWGLWRPHWEERGYGRGRYCMARHGDKGPYASGNVAIVTNEQNTAEWLRSRSLRQRKDSDGALAPSLA
jgi:hypothetical protein